MTTFARRWRSIFILGGLTATLLTSIGCYLHDERYSWLGIVYWPFSVCCLAGSAIGQVNKWTQTGERVLGSLIFISAMALKCTMSADPDKFLIEQFSNMEGVQFFLFALMGGSSIMLVALSDEDGTSIGKFGFVNDLFYVFIFANFSLMFLTFYDILVKPISWLDKSAEDGAEVVDENDDDDDDSTVSVSIGGANSTSA
ncbi:hypothetical protein TL16_g05806 [Triparma laevis f. inornata]|uniref:Uncharacterized protein n=2 Tax=Triparma laevis TaxID=1534972 RepID=A0A9W7FQQ7_9STRA|nr:hypothetical protein TL16_g05806 [Triparma laevis f. inornata]GMI17244.1 hypothetical protein TrLO_g13391 [Triparma laevis f. longispina]